MNAITSKEAIMQVCRKLAAEKGTAALNMRAVADECGIALGTLYNYYADKDELLLAAVESIWQEIFHTDQPCGTNDSFPDYVGHLFACIRQGASKYPNFVTAHAVGIAQAKKGEAKSEMERCFEHMKRGLLTVLDADPALDPAAFSDAFTREDFAQLVLDQMLLLLVQKKTDCSVLLGLIRRVIYR